MCEDNEKALQNHDSVFQDLEIEIWSRLLKSIQKKDSSKKKI